MDRLEDALRQALRREEPPDALTRRILAPPSGAWENWRGWFRLPTLRLATAVAGVMLLLLGVQYNAEQRRRAQGEAAKSQMMVALRITAGKLEYARLKVRKVTTGDEELAHPEGPPAVRPANSI